MRMRTHSSHSMLYMLAVFSCEVHLILIAIIIESLVSADGLISRRLPKEYMVALCNLTYLQNKEHHPQTTHILFKSWSAYIMCVCVFFLSFYCFLLFKLEPLVVACRTTEGQKWKQREVMSIGYAHCLSIYIYVSACERAAMLACRCAAICFSVFSSYFERITQDRQNTSKKNWSAIYAWWWLAIAPQNSALSFHCDRKHEKEGAQNWHNIYIVIDLWNKSFWTTFVNQWCKIRCISRQKYILFTYTIAC